MSRSRSNSADWGSDVAPSSPVAPDRPRMVHFGGFCFTDGGIAIDISEVEAEAFRTAPIAPYNGSGS
jgi:hypothetical protein